MRELTMAAAIREATEQCMAQDSSVYIMGLGVPDPGAIWGTTSGLLEKFGAERVMDMPIAENGMTGIAIGSALAGMRPILTHQRVDFALLSMEQIVNQAAKWFYTSNGTRSIPLVIRMVVGRGWGQGPQHSQSLHSWFAHIPGLKVVMPFSPYDAKGLLISAIEDDNPVVFIEHRWLHNLKSGVPEEMYRVPLGTARVVHEGSDVTLIGSSHMTYECLRAVNLLNDYNVSAHVLDVRSLRPLDVAAVVEAAKRTGRVIIADGDWAHCGFSSEIISTVVEHAFSALKCSPRRLTWPDYPLPTSPALFKNFYPTAVDIAEQALDMMGIEIALDRKADDTAPPHDVPDLSFEGPF
jgi:pyruvate dehydrogenase E1 component beta subunit